MSSSPAASSVAEGSAPAGKNQLYMVAFRLDRQICTLPIEIIDQIMDMVYLTRLPEVNDSIEGVFNYHGKTVPVVNLRAFLSLPRLPIHLHTPIILVNFSGHTIGLIVDQVIGVVSHAQSAVSLPKDLLPQHLGEITILDGLVQSSENYMLMLNLEQLFSASKKGALAQTLDHFAGSAHALKDQRVMAAPEYQAAVPGRKNGPNGHAPKPAQKSPPEKTNGRKKP